jgi:NADH dehydrogenase (ubiquinone) Fe-S protein 3
MELKKLTKIENIIPVISSSLSISNEKIIVISHLNLLFVFNILKYHFGHQYKLLSCISGVDYISCKYRFGIIYDLLSLKYNSRLRIKVFVNEVTSIETITNIYINSDWWEREVWDMYGIYFNNHKDLRRILTDYGFEGYPLRKDFPLSGYIELKYDQTKKRIVLEPLELSQEFRNYSFEMPW